MIGFDYCSVRRKGTSLQLETPGKLLGGKHGA